MRIEEPWGLSRDAILKIKEKGLNVNARKKGIEKSQKLRKIRK